MVSQLKHPLEIIATYPSHKARCFIGQLCLVPGTCFMPSRSPRRGHEAKGSVGYFFSPCNSELLNPHFISIDEHVWHKLNTSLIHQASYSIQKTFIGAAKCRIEQLDIQVVCHCFTLSLAHTAIYKHWRTEYFNFLGKCLCLFYPHSYLIKRCE